jgi:hypothetical protein
MLHISMLESLQAFLVVVIVLVGPNRDVPRRLGSPPQSSFLARLGQPGPNLRLLLTEV